MIMCKNCRIPFEEGAQFCGNCGGFVDYVGVSEESAARAAAAAGAPGPAAGSEPAPNPDTAQMLLAVSAADDAERRAVADAEAADREQADALARAAAAAAAEAAARAAAATEADTEAKVRAEAEARAQAAAKAKAQAEADAAARAAEASRRAAAMIAKPSPTPRPPTPTVSSSPVTTPPPPPTPGTGPPPPPVQPGEVACPQCGTGNPSSRTFCRQCGTELRPAAAVPAAAAKAPKGGFWQQWKVPIIGAVILALVLGFVLTRDDGTDDLPDVSTTEPAPPTSAQPRSEVVTVEANVPFVDTGIELEVGDHVEIVARGEAESGGGTSGPEGDPNPDYRSASVIDGGHNALIAKIGLRGDPFLVAQRLTFDAEEAGPLFLGVNDTGVDNNSGAYVADVTVS